MHYLLAVDASQAAVIAAGPTEDAPEQRTNLVLCLPGELIILLFDFLLHGLYHVANDPQAEFGCRRTDIFIVTLCQPRF